jgi:hypothetical protein
MAQDEIDLIREFAKFCYFLKRNYLLTIFLPLLGALAAIAWFMPNEKTESSFFGETTLLTSEEVEFLFTQLEKTDSLPGLTREQRHKVSKIRFKVFEKDAGAQTVILEKITFLEVNVSVSDRHVFPFLQESIIRFLTSSPSYLRRKAEREKFYNQMIERIDRELVELEEMKNKISSKDQTSTLDPSELYSTAVELYREKEQYQVKKADLNSFHVAKSFENYTIDRKPTPLLAGIVGFAFGFLVLIVVLAIKYFIQYFRNYEKTIS